MLPVPSRVKAFDWLRGIAVVFMVETHALVLLRPELRGGVWAARLNFINGLVAPAFIFAAGFSLGLVQVRSANKDRWRRIRRTLRRICEVLAVGALVNFIWFPIRKEPIWLLRMDILPCIGVSLLLALPVVALLARRPVVLTGSLLVLALAIFFAAPFGEAVQGPWAALVNRTGKTQSVFPLLPWAGYVLLGASVGAVAASQSLSVLKRSLFGLVLLGAALWQATPLFLRWYPPHTFAVSDPANHGERWMLVGLLLLGLLTLEEKTADRWKESLPVRWINLLGTTSLAAYFFHEELLYYELFGVSLAKIYRDRCGWGQYLLLLALLLFATTLLTKAVDRLYPKWEALLGRSRIS